MLLLICDGERYLTKGPCTRIQYTAQSPSKRVHTSYGALQKAKHAEAHWPQSAMVNLLSSFVLLQICKAGVARMRKIWFSRHGESEYNMYAKIGGDSNISPQGQVYAKLLPDLMVDRVPLVCLHCACAMLVFLL